MSDDSAGREIASREVFDNWIEGMQPGLAGLQDFYLPRDFPFDYSRESLFRLEVILLDKYSSIEEVYDPANLDFADRCVRYIGETLIYNFGGDWDYQTDPLLMHSGVPFVQVDDGAGISIAPRFEITALVDRRTGSELTGLYDGIRSRYEAYQQAKPPAERHFPGKHLVRISTAGEQTFLDRWIGDMDDVLGRWRSAYLPDDFPFDFSRASLEILEEIVLARMPSPEAVLASENAEFVDGVNRYLGETLVRAGFCSWRFRDLPGSDDIFDRVPFVETVGAPVYEHGMVTNPWSAVWVAAKKRTGGRFARHFDTQRETFLEFHKGTS